MTEHATSSSVLVSEHRNIFVSYASEDLAFVRPLVELLQALGLSVWFAEFSLHAGDSLAASIDRGMATADFGLVIVSQHFMRKHWPKVEMYALLGRDIDQGKRLIPVWHGVDLPQVQMFSALLADKVAVRSDELTPEDLAIQILREVRPDLYQATSRDKLRGMAVGQMVEDLQIEIVRAGEELQGLRTELAQYRCLFCGSELVQRGEAPTDPEERDWDIVESFACGFSQFAGRIQHPCPGDPRFPQFDDFRLRFNAEGANANARWWCHANGETEMARLVSIPPGVGRTREEAARRLRDNFEEIAKAH